MSLEIQIPSESHLPSSKSIVLNTNFVTQLRTEWFGNVRGDVLAGLVVALALIPEAIAF